MIDKNKTLELADNYFRRFVLETEGKNIKTGIKSRQVKAALFALIDAINENTIQVSVVKEMPLHERLISVPLVIEQPTNVPVFKC